MKTSVEIVLRPSYISQGYINIGKKYWDSFPAVTREVELEAEPIGVIHTQFYVEVGGSHHGFSKNLRPWFEAPPKPKAGDTLRITIQNESYRLEIPK